MSTPANTPPSEPSLPRCTAFAGAVRLASGPLVQVARITKAALDAGETERVLIFDDLTSEVIELDFRGTVDDVMDRLSVPASPGPEMRESHRGPGRPKLGVVPREVTLLPRHWDWLNAQPGGASVTLRRLVEEARRSHADRDRIRLAKEAAYRFMAAMAGDLPGFEEATRALFAGDRERFHGSMASWPPDLSSHAGKVAASAFSAD